MDGLYQDLRYGLRGLARNPGFTLAALLTLSVGIGANSAIFSVVEAVLLRPLPFAAPNRLVTVWETNPGQGRDHDRPSPGNVADWRRRSRAFSGLAVFHPGTATLRDEQGPAAVSAVKVSPDFFQLLGVEAALGQAFRSPEVSGAAYNLAEQYLSGDRVAVLSDALWRRRFGSDPAIAGKSISLDGLPWRVAAVMPPGFAMPPEEDGLWVAWDIPRTFANFAGGPPRDFRFVHVLGRLAPGVSRERADADLASLATTLAAEHPKENRGWSARTVPLHDELVGSARQGLLVLFGATALVLLLACVNVAGLQIARLAARQRELAVRLALGATAWRLQRQMVTESLVLALAGGGLGLAGGQRAVDGLLALQPAGLAGLEQVELNPRVLAFTFVIACLAALAAGLAPALRGEAPASRLGGGRSKSAVPGASGGAGLRRALVIGELAMAVVLLVGAGLFARSFATLRAVDPGFRPENLLVMRIALDNASYKHAAQSEAFYRALIARLEALPGVRSAGAVTALPMSPVGIDFDRPFWRQGEADPGGAALKADIRMATPRYFQTMGMRILEGRAFSAADRKGSPPVVVVNQTLARQVWPGGRAVGRQVVIDYQRGPYPYEVVGIVNDTRFHGLRSTPRPEIFIPHAQNPYLATNVVIHTAGNPRRLVNAARREVAAVDRAQPVHSVVTMEELVAGSLAADRFAALLLAVLGGVALLLAGTGVFGLLSYLVSRRTPEIGLRVALGARRRDVLGMVLRESLAMALLGALAGIALALALGPVVGHLLYGIRVTDPWTLGGVAAFLAVLALAAAYLPARHALQIEPTAALRGE